MGLIKPSKKNYKPIDPEYESIRLELSNLHFDFLELLSYTNRFYFVSNLDPRFKSRILGILTVKIDNFLGNLDRVISQLDNSNYQDLQKVVSKLNKSLRHITFTLNSKRLFDAYMVASKNCWLDVQESMRYGC